MAKLKAMKASSEARTLRITAGARPPVTVEDVLVGDVWLCSGQSNMEMGIGNCNAPGDIASANFPQIRLLTVPKLVAQEPVQVVSCQWTGCSPATVSQGGWGGFSAAGFYFGRELERELNIPIGLIHSSWGGTIAEAWTSFEALAPLGDFKDRLEQVAASRPGPGATDYLAVYEKWCQRNDPGTAQGWEKPGSGNRGMEIGGDAATVRTSRTAGFRRFRLVPEGD